MAMIIKKGTNASAFRLSNGKVYTFEPEVMTVLNDDEYELLMKEYGSFIKPRIISEKNPMGYFIVSEKQSYGNDMNKEVGLVQDNSSKVDVDKIEAEKLKAKIQEIKETEKEEKPKKEEKKPEAVKKTKGRKKKEK